MLSPSTKLGRYEIRSKLGAGGMGEVYLAEDTQLERIVALKILPDDVAEDKRRMLRFVHEAKIASSLNHPNILTIHEISQADSTHFIATEFIDGQTLRERMRSARIKLSDALNVAIQTADALAAAHEAGVVHRDIKPENIMLRRRDSIVKVLDFGLAKLTERQPSTVDPEAATKTLLQTDAGVVLGTALYMSPEQARGLAVDARTDIWSLGVVLYEMIAGNLPFEGSTTNEILAAMLNEREAPPLVRFAREAPAELERIVEKALKKDREERYQVIKDMALDLKRLRQKLQFDAELERSVAPHAEPTAQPSAPRLHVSDTAPATSAEYLVTGIKRHKRGVLIGLSTLLLAFAGAAYLFYFARPVKAIDSIAVLPLANASNDPNTEYLSDGITESIISNLSQLPRLRVMARASVFRFKGKEVDPKEVGRQLGVQAILMGRLLQQGERLVIRAELVNVSDGTQMWGGEYDRKVADALSIQHEIAREISEKLRLRLTGEEQKRLTGRDTTNADAYQFYLKGRYFWNKRTTDGIRKAIEQFQQAIDRDQNYALGYVGLADCYLVLELWAGVPSSETLPKARAAADHALRIDDSLAEAHASSAHIYQQMWRWAEAEAEYKRAISLNPNYPTAHHWFSLYFRLKRQFDDSMREIKRAQELDPLSPVISTNVAITYLLKNELTSAIGQCERIIELDPSFPETHAILGHVYLKQRRHDEALAEFQKAVELSGRSSMYLTRLGYFYAVTGRRADALQMLRELEEKYARGEAIGQYLASVYSGLGDKDQAFAWLERDFEQRSGQLPTFPTRFGFEELRSDPRYTDVVRRMGLNP